ncbi:MAG: polysaccharide biosynthesis C-terminal domain-containing protein [Candidatus Coatesbacteria bacterium]|nr:polysaccharide biosynthesis C-terminal domain-containing protein [Candidatus Coatesbacteria bacterium]
MSFFAQSSWTFSSNLVTKAFAFVLSVYIAQTFGPEGRGEYAYLVLLSTLGTIWGGFGISSAGVYYYNNSSQKESILKTVWLSGFLMGLLGIIFVYIFLAILKPETAKNPYIFYGAFFGVLSSMLINHAQKIYLATGRIKSYNYVMPSLYLPIFLGILVSHLFFYKQINAVLACWFSCMFLMSMYWIFKSKPSSGNFSLAILYSLMIFGIQSQVGVILQLVNYQVDKIYIEKMLSTEWLGIYAVAVSLSQGLMIIPTSAATILYPKASKGSLNSDDSAFICRIVLWILLLASIVLGLSGKLILRYVFGEDYVAGYLTLIILLGATFAAAPGQLLSSDLTGRGKPFIGTIAAFFGVITNIVLNFYFIPKYKIVGAAITSLFSYSTTSLIICFYFMSFHKSCFTRLIIPQKGDFRKIRTALKMK